MGRVHINSRPPSERRTRPVSLARTGLALLGLACLPLTCWTGCAPTSNSAIPEAPPWYNRANGALQVIYQKALVAESRRSGEPYEQGRAALDPVHSRVYVGSSDRGLYALSARDGHVIWRFETLGPVQSEPLYDPQENVVYFGSHDGALYKVRARDGKLLWRFDTHAEVAQRPVLFSETLYFVNANDTVLAVDANTGERRWSQHRSPALGMEISGHAGIAVLDGLVYVAFSAGTVTAFDAETGRERWLPVDLSAEAEQTLGEVPKYLDVDTTPIPLNLDGRPAVAVASYAGGVFALDAQTGDQIWSNPGVLGTTSLTMWQQPAHEDIQGNLHPRRTHLIANTGTTGLWALDPSTGEELWQRDLPDGGVSQPAFIAGAMIVTTTTHGVYLISPLNGGVIDGLHTEVGFSAPPTAYGTRAFVMSDAGKLMALAVSPPRPR